MKYLGKHPSQCPDLTLQGLGEMLIVHNWITESESGE